MEWIIVGVASLVALVLIMALLLRRVVSTNEVHIVQSRKSTKSYGKDTENGNTYYEWPSWIPVIGLTKIVLPVSVFNLNLADYEAYDKERVPLVVDVAAFFRITDSNLAAQRVSSFQELGSQLRSIVQGSVRTILASSDIQEIMQGRGTFGEAFTKEVAEQLASWGVSTVKNLELMDIRDASGSKVIHNIMEKKKSHIEMESRVAVAENRKKAEIAEIDASRDTALQQQIAQQSVGLRTVEAEREVEVSKQLALQLIKEQERETKEKEMAVIKVSDVKRAEIDKDVSVVKAQQEKETAILIAEGELESQKREAEGIAITGQAKADAEKAMQLAPVEAQIVLAKEIGENKGYQEYLVTIRQVEANQVVGIEQAKALEKADIKIITNAGDPVSGMSNVMELFTSKGGTNLGSMLEGLAQTEQGKALLSKLTPA